MQWSRKCVVHVVVLLLLLLLLVLLSACVSCSTGSPGSVCPRVAGVDTPENFAYLTNRFHEVIAAARGEANLLFQVAFNVRESSMALLHL